MISGTLRGAQLPLLPNAQLRPTAERVREALFSILGSAVCGVAVLDLFAGTGSLGFEALSRGAKSVTLVEKEVRLAKKLVEFCDDMQLSDDVTILNTDAARAVNFLAKREIRFGLILLDPPYDSDWISMLFSSDSFLGLSLSGGLIVVERTKFNQKIEGSGKIKLEKTFSRKYGSSILEIFESTKSQD
jgi:16S rRNA (guanine(966)-N(2))-methyltransferase RsmD